MNINNVAELHAQLKQSKKHNSWKEEMRDNESVRTCPHCGRGKNYRHGTGKFLIWTPCKICGDLRKYPKII